MKSHSETLFGADVLVFENGDVSITGTQFGFTTRSLVRGKGVEDDWAKTAFK